MLLLNVTIQGDAINETHFRASVGAGSTVSNSSAERVPTTRRSTSAAPHAIFHQTLLHLMFVTDDADNSTVILPRTTTMSFRWAVSPA
jgi:hypothetical protein